MPGPNPGCCGCGGTTPDPDGPVGIRCVCTDATIPRSLSLSFSAATYGNNWSPLQPDSNDYTADRKFKPSVLAYFAPGTVPGYYQGGANNNLYGAWWSVSPFQAEEPDYQGGYRSFTAAYALGCCSSLSTWCLSYNDLRPAPYGSGITEWLFSVTKAAPPNTCSPFLLACGNKPNNPGICNYAFNIH